MINMVNPLTYWFHFSQLLWCASMVSFLIEYGLTEIPIDANNTNLVRARARPPITSCAGACHYSVRNHSQFRHTPFQQKKMASESRSCLAPLEQSGSFLFSRKPLHPLRIPRSSSPVTVASSRRSFLEPSILDPFLY